jgi:hypothetical protein
MEYTIYELCLMYVAGTIFGYYVGKSTGIRQASVTAVDTLMAAGYLRWRRNDQGEVEILKQDESA